MSYGKLIPEHGSTPTSKYGFVNETAIRVGAGIMFTLGIITFLITYYTQDYRLALIVVGVFWIDFILKVINPQYSIMGNIARLLTKHKEKVRVGAIQKRFAWSIGLVLSTLVLGALGGHFLFDASATIRVGLVRPMWICMLCLVFMRCEAILGYCVGCDVFKFLTTKGILHNHDNQNCPDDICEH